MTTSVGGATQLIVATATVLVATIAGLIGVGRRMRRELGLGAARQASLDGLDAIPPALVRQALERGLVTSAQLATMTPIERQFVLASVRRQLGADAPSPRLAKSPMTQPPATLAGSIPNTPRLSVWCPLCGEPLKLPPFPPIVAVCSACGTKTAVRDDSGPGRYVLIATAPQTPKR